MGSGRPAETQAALLEPYIESFLYFFDIQGRYRECVDLTQDAVRALQSTDRQPGASFLARGGL